MSDCEKCWDSLCTCGWEYRHWTPGKVEALIATLFEVLDRRRRGVPDPREEYDHPRPALTKADFERTIVIDTSTWRAVIGTSDPRRR